MDDGHGDQQTWVEEEDPRAVVAALISDLPAAAAITVSVGGANRYLNGDWPTAEDRLVAARQLLWQDPVAGLDAVLAQVADVDIEGEDRLAVIQLAVSVSPAAQLATVWLLDRIDYAYLEDLTRYEAGEIATAALPGAVWWPDAFAFIARNPHLNIDARTEAAACLVGRTPGRAAYLTLPSWFSMEVLPPSLHTAMENGSGWAYNLLRLIATDTEMPGEVRVDAAEWLTMDPDKSESVGEEVLVSILEDDRADPLVRSRALVWLEEDNEDTRDAIEELLRRPERAVRWPVERSSTDPVADYLALYRVALAGAVDAYERKRKDHLDELSRPR